METVFAVDVDDDGHVDVVTASRFEGAEEILLYRNDGSQNFGNPVVVASADTPSVYATDVDGDGKVDVIYADADKRVSYYAQGTDYTIWGSEINIDNGRKEAMWVVAADLDGDDDVDVLCADPNKKRKEIVVYENVAGDGSTWDDKKYATGKVSSVELFDVDGDGDLDFVGSITGASKIIWWLNGGGMSFTAKNDPDPDDDGLNDDLNDEGAEDVTTVVALDIDADGDLDVVAAEADKLTWYENDCTPVPTAAPSAAPTISLEPTVSFQPTPGPTITFKPTHLPTERPTMKQFHCAENAFDVTHKVDEPLPSGCMSDSSCTYDGAKTNMAIFAIDMDGDYDVDFLATNAGNDAVAWYTNDGYEDFTKVTITDTSQGSYKVNGAEDVFAIDVDGDGEVDVLSASSSDHKIAW